MLQIGFLNLRPFTYMQPYFSQTFHVHAAILLSILEISQDIRIFCGTQYLNNESLEAPTFSVPVEKLSLPGTHIFASSTVNSLVILSGGRGAPSQEYCNHLQMGCYRCVCIYFVVVQSSDCQFCLDAQVMRGASCWSDHYMVRAKLCFRFQKAVSGKTGRKRTFAVHHLECKREISRNFG